MHGPILLVEDNEQNRYLATYLLELGGFTVIPAMTGREALEKARSVRPALILLDIQLPDIDGYDLCRQIKADPDLAGIPIVALTSYAFAGERQKALDLGVSGYIEKPIDQSSFVDQVTQFATRTSGSVPTFKVLAVDDLPENRYLLQQLLGAQNLQVELAGSGHEALEKLHSGKYQLIVSDIMMPHMDGFQLCRAVQSDERLKPIPFVFYTSTYTDPKDEAFAKSLGAVDFIAKPIDSAEFASRIFRVLRTQNVPQALTLPRQPSEVEYLREYSQRLVQKLETKIAEAEEANRKLKELNDSLEQRVRERTAEIDSKNHELALRNAELQAFAYTAAHDLRAPLRSIQGFITALAEEAGGALGEPGQAYLARVTNAAARMERLIQELLEYSNLAKADVRIAPVSLNTVVDHALSNLQHEVQASGASVRIDRPLPTVKAVELMLVQALQNLINNALKFVKPGVPPELRIRAETSDNRARLWIEDNGIGIPPEHQQRIFNVFERLHDESAYPGTGLGLAIVQKAVERMGGKVGVDSEVGKGSSFWIEMATA